MITKNIKKIRGVVILGKIKLITHTDLDGVGCYIVLKKVYKNDEIECNFLNYNDTQKFFNEFNDYQKFDRIFITDLSFSKDSIEFNKLLEIERNNIPVIYIDHHKTTFKGLNNQIINEENSATLLLFNYFNNINNLSNSLKEFAECVSLWDTWQWKNHKNIEKVNLAKNLSRIFKYLGINGFNKSILCYDFNKNEKFILPSYLKLISDREFEHTNLYVTRKYQTMKIVYFDGYKTALIFAEKNSSEIADYILNNEEIKEDIDLVMIINLDIKNVSFRSSLNSNVDVSTIAKRYGGGGHFHAAGCQIGDNYIIKELIREIII